MTFANISKGLQQTRDSIGSHPSKLPIPIIGKDTLQLYEEPYVIIEEIISSGAFSLHAAVPPNDVYYNFLRDTTTNQALGDGTSAPGLLVSQTTGALDLTNNRIDLDSGDSVEWVLAKGLKNSVFITKATPIINTNSDRTNASFSASAGATFPYTFPITFSDTGISLSLSADGGANWQAANNGETITFTNPGTELRMRWTSSANGLYWKTADSDGYEVPITVTFTTN